MPTENLQKKITVTEQEWKRVSKDQRPGESDSNFLRRKLGLDSLQHGGERAQKKKAR